MGTDFFKLWPSTYPTYSRPATSVARRWSTRSGLQAALMLAMLSNTRDKLSSTRLDWVAESGKLMDLKYYQPRAAVVLYELLRLETNGSKNKLSIAKEGVNVHDGLLRRFHRQNLSHLSKQSSLSLSLNHLAIHEASRFRLHHINNISSRSIRLVLGIRCDWLDHIGNISCRFLRLVLGCS